MSENGTCGPDTDELPHGLAFRDEFSEILGNNRETFGGKIWP